LFSLSQRGLFTLSNPLAGNAMEIFYKNGLGRGASSENGENFVLISIVFGVNGNLVASSRKHRSQCNFLLAALLGLG
jgi:hypothetical protein